MQVLRIICNYSFKINSISFSHKLAYSTIHEYSWSDGNSFFLGKCLSMQLFKVDTKLEYMYISMMFLELNTSLSQLICFTTKLLLINVRENLTATLP